MTNDMVMAILQWFSGAFLVILVPLLGWTVKQVHTLRSDFEGHKGRVDAEIGSMKDRAENDGVVIDRRFDELRDWVKGNNGKLDVLVSELHTRPCQAQKGRE